MILTYLRCWTFRRWFWVNMRAVILVELLSLYPQKGFEMPSRISPLTLEDTPKVSSGHFILLLNLYITFSSILKLLASVKTMFLRSVSSRSNTGIRRVFERQFLANGLISRIICLYVDMKAFKLWHRSLRN